MRKLLPLLFLILIGCSEPEPKDINILNLDDSYYYYLDTKYSGVYSDKNNSDFYYMGQMSKGKYHGYFKKFDYEDNLISETTFVNGFNTGPLVFYTKDGVSSIFEGELEMRERVRTKSRYKKDSEWELWDSEIIESSSDYKYRIRVDYSTKKWTSLVKISDSEENLYFGYYKPHTWIEERYTQFSVNNFEFEMSEEEFSDIYTEHLNESDFKKFEEYKRRNIQLREKKKDKYQNDATSFDINDIGDVLNALNNAEIKSIKNMTFQKYREQENPYGYLILNNKNNFKVIKKIELLEKNKFFIKLSMFEDGWKTMEQETIWEKVVED